MARTNKYASINFNHVYEKNLTTANDNGKHPYSPPPSLCSTTIANPSSFNNLYKNHLPSARSHGRMLVLTRPASKPLSSAPSPSEQRTTPSKVAESLRVEPSSDQISLRPLGRNRGDSSLVSHLRAPPIVGNSLGVGSSKIHKFVPPHLRPGFVARPEHKQYQNQQQQYGNDGRPKSVGGGDVDPGPGLLNPPISSGGSRPSSSA